MVQLLSTAWALEELLVDLLDGLVFEVSDWAAGKGCRDPCLSFPFEQDLGRCPDLEVSRHHVHGI